MNSIKGLMLWIIIMSFSYLSTDNDTYAQVIEQDSLALVAFYDSTDGANWTNNSNWLTSAVSDWYGITTENERVIGIEMFSNNLSGTLPPEIENLDSLKTLSVGRNNITGSIPSLLFGLTKLENLYLDHNQFEGEISGDIANLENLVRINLGRNLLTGELPQELYTMTQLTYFEVYSNELYGEIPSEISNLINLATLSLSNNDFSGEIFNYLVNMEKLRLVFIPNNSFTGIIPSTIENLTDLYTLNAAGNDFTGEIPSEIGSLSKLNFLSIADNQLTGSIPMEIGELSNLETLYLYRNHLNDTIPKEIGNLSNLKKLYLSENELVGLIPAEIGNISGLEQIYFQNNNLTGNLPLEITQLTNLERLYLDRNDLEGAIPAGLVNMTKLKDIQLFDNKFVDLPDLSSLPMIEELEIQNNQFTFEDIEPNIDTFYFSYSPQDSVGLRIDTTLSVGGSITLSVDVGGSANLYQWTKDGIDISGATANTYSIDGADNEDTGIYICKINNSIATELTLYCREINVTVGGTTDLKEADNIPEKFMLYQNYPNPFNPATTIEYSVARDEKRETREVQLVVYDILGREILTLVNENQKPGIYEVKWDAGLYPSGIYFYELTAGNLKKSKKMVLMR